MNRALLLLLATLTLTAGCVSINHQPAAANCCSTHSDGQWIQTELFFGLSRPDGSLISSNDWKGFLDGEILTRFPKGLTVVNAEGRYLDNQQRTIREPSEIVVLLYPVTGAAAADGNITAIARSYCRQFNQESVMRTDSAQTTSFLTR